MREFRSYGSVGGASGNRCFYPEGDTKVKFPNLLLRFIGEIIEYLDIISDDLETCNAAHNIRKFGRQYQEIKIFKSTHYISNRNKNRSF